MQHFHGVTPSVDGYRLVLSLYHYYYLTLMPASMDVGGLFQSSAPVLRDANLAYLAYCTSDAYIGDAAASSNDFGFAFRGRAVVDAAFGTLRSKFGLGAAANTSLVYRCEQGDSSETLLETRI